MKLRQAEEIKKFGKKLGDKVTVVSHWNPEKIGEYVVHIRNFEFVDFVRASLLLKHIQAFEFPENHSHLIG